MKTPILSSTCLFVTALLSAFTSLSFGGEGPIETHLQKGLDEGIRKYEARGVSAAVIFHDGKIWTGSSGISHGTVPIEPDILFMIGSITKNVVAALTLQLVEEGILSLDDPLSKWLPAYPHVDSTATLRQLLNHTSGIYMFWSNQRIWDDMTKDESKIWTPEEVLSYIKEPYFAPGDSDPRICKMASSAAHVAHEPGKQLISSESCTWMREHWHGTLGQIKLEMDLFFLAGVNHVFYHGTSYYPKDAPWPSWFFYASTKVD